jgi:hypothetical protein
MILTIGCSFTYGSELTNREETAWPYLLSKKLDTPVVNRAEGGASNDYIFRTAIEETVQTNYDLVIIQWSEPSRMEVWHGNRPISVTAHSNWKQIGQLSWMQDYYKYSYNDVFRYRTWYSHVIALQEYFKNKKQKYLFCNLAGLRGYYKDIDGYYNSLKHLWDSVDEQYYVGWPTDGFLEFQGDCEKGSGGHPLELGHERISNKIYEHIRNIGWFS